MRRSRGPSSGACTAPDGEVEKRPPLLLRYPKRTLLLGVIVVAFLSIFGFSLEDRLNPSTIEISGTETSRATGMLNEYFGDSAPFVVFLQGPPKALDEQGPELIRALRRDPKVTTLSPWDQGAVGRLRPSPRRAFILLDFHVDNNEAVDDKVPLLNEEIERAIHAPVRGTQTGVASLSRAIEDKSISSTEHSELIALPVLLIVLLLVFRSPIAAAIPLGFGALSVLSSRGLLAILTNFFDVSAIALVVCSMLGLALGVDYALLMVSRFREELADGADPIAAAWTTRRTAARTVAFAGSTLVLSMVVALLVVPGALLASLAGTLAMVVVLTVLIATLLGPSVLVLVGENIDRWRIGPAPNGERSRLMSLVAAALRRPVPVAAAIGAVVLLLAAPALALKTGPFSIGQLPKNDPAREDAELIEESAGGGLEAPFVMVAATTSRPITEEGTLDTLDRWQKRLADTPGVQSVIGPSQLTRAVRPLQKGLSGLLASNNKTGPIANIDRLSKNLDRLSNGVATVRTGLSRATAGVGLLAKGSGRIEEGAIQIATGVGQAAAGSQEAIDAIGEVSKGNKQLASALERASLGALQLKFATHDLVPNFNANGLPRAKRLSRSLGAIAKEALPQAQANAQAGSDQVNQALQQVEGMTVGKTDPNYAAALDALRQASGTTAAVPGELAKLKEVLDQETHEAEEIKRWIESTLGQMRQVASAAKRLSEGLDTIKKGSKELAAGTATLDREANKELSQLGPFQEGAEELVAGLARLTGATTEVERQLAAGYARSYPLQSGSRRIAVRVQSQGETIKRRLNRLRGTTPGIFDSGYFVLSALDGTRGELNERANEAVDLNHGGQAAIITVIPKDPLNTSGSIALNRKLDDEAKAMSRESGLKTGVTGGPAILNTFSEVTKDSLPIEIAAIVLATFLVLVLVLRSLPLAALAIALNMASVGVAFGVLMLLTNVPEGWPLGGRTYIDAVSTVMIFGVVFGLSIDYAVFLLVRMREHYDEFGDNAKAIEFGLEKTARVITGAAVIMMAVFIAFAGAPIATVSQIGIGLTVAVILDATVVRVVLLPALMLLIGDRVWWLPKSLERTLPRLNV
ncbi:MAG TPA: MMPL family transporter [Solirubrobacterales bacterium]|nr:MMPL family transporter [Solirubrobacterales bacterium]